MEEEAMALFVKLLDVPYHAQEEVYYCGPACAQMVLDDSAISIATQCDLYTTVCHSSKKWFTNPQGLADTLSKRSTTVLDATHDDQGFDDQASATRAICWTIFKHDRPPVALINGRKHWVVVTGCILSRRPTADYSVIALVLQDPNFTPAQGGGGNGQIELVTYAYWLSHQFKNKVNLKGDTYYRKWVVVGAEDAPVVSVQGPPPATNNAGPVGANGAVTAAREGVRQDYVQAVDSIRMALQEADARPGVVVPVARTGRRVPFAYVVPFYDRDDRIPAAVLIDAGTGAF